MQKSKAPIKTRSRKAKGSRLEKWVKTFFEDFGFPSRKQPGSGIYSDFPHDNCIELPGVGRLIIECKNWKHGWRTGDKAMGSADMLCIKRDHGTPCFYIPENTMVAICRALQEAQPEWLPTGKRVDPNLFKGISPSSVRTKPLPEVPDPAPAPSKQIPRKGFK